MKELLQSIYNIHDIECNQKYNEYPYSLHLKAVVAQVGIYIPLLRHKMNTIDPKRFFGSELSWIQDLQLAAAGHDLIEDARKTYNDVRDVFGSFVADLIYSCTEEKGKDRKERHSDKFFEELSKERWGVFIKLCDIKANILFSILTNSSMYKKYQSEFNHLYSKLYKEGEFDIIWKDIENLLNL